MNIWEVYSKFPHLLLEYSILAIQKSYQEFGIFYNKLSPATQDILLRLYSQLDILYVLFSVFVLIFVLGSRNRKASWIDVFLTLFWAIIAGSLLFFSYHQLTNSQLVVWSRKMEIQGKNPELETFKAIVPMDMNPNVTYQSILLFFDSSGSRGRTFYGLYLFFDIFLLISTTILHRQVFSITFQGNGNPFMKFMVQRLPLAIAALDLYENSCLAVCLYYYSKMIRNEQSKWEISLGFVDRIRMAISSKFLLIYIVVALQVLGLTLYFGKKSSEVKPTSKSKKK